MKKNNKLYINKENLVEFHNEFEEALGKYEKPCKKGCVSCCKQYISLFSFEVIHFKKAINKLKLNIKQQVKRNYTQYIDYFLANIPNNKTFYYFDLFEGENNYSRRHALDRYPCPFLIDNSCVVYKDRPIVCRLHFVSDQPELCELTPLRNAALPSINLQMKFTEFLVMLGDWHLVPSIYTLRDVFDKKQKLPNIIYKQKPETDA